MQNHPWNALPPHSLKVIQLSDTHLYADPNKKMRNVKTLDSLQAVIKHAFAHYGPFDFALATGDLTQHAEVAAYEYLTTMLNQLLCPVYCLPGNHDEVDAMHEHLQSVYVSTPKVIDRGVWRVILLDSLIPGEHSGHLAPNELLLLQTALDAQRPTLVALHHQPVPVNSHSIDQMALDNPSDFWAILDHAPQAKGVVWGHVHQAFEQERKHVRLLACPSTCIQFKPDDFVATNTELLLPGYRLIGLLPNGEIQTDVIRVKYGAGR